MDISIAGGIKLSDGYQIPRLAFGTFDLEDGKQTQQAVECAIAAGFRHIDCARFYGNEKGVGAALANISVPREELFITSKVWNDRQIDGTVRESVEESLRDLGLDYLNLLLVHWPVQDHFIDTWKIFEEIKEAGLARSIGVSNHTVTHLKALADNCETVPAVDQMERHPYLQNADTFEYCKQNGIVYEAWSPLGRGGCLADETIAEIANAHGVSAAQIIIAWHIAHGVIPLPRSKNPERIKANAEAINVVLTEKEISTIDALDKGKPVLEGIDPEHFNEYLNNLSSHFE